MRKGYEIFDRHGRKRDEDDDAPLRDGETLRVPMFMMDSSNSTPLQRAIAKHSHELGTPKLMRDARRRRRVTERDPMGRLRSTFTEEPDEQDDDDNDKRDSTMNTNDECTFVDSRGITFIDHRIVDTRRALERLQAQQEELRQLYRDGAVARQEAYEDMKRQMSDAWRKDAAPSGAYPYRAAAEGTACTINGRPGTLVREGDYLVCKPSARQDAEPTFDAVEGARRKQEAYDAMIKEMSEAWRGGK
jgi:hypothetical protein